MPSARTPAATACAVAALIAAAPPALSAGSSSPELSAASAQVGAPGPVRYTLDGARDALVTRNLAVLAARHNVDLFRAQRLAAALRPEPTLVVTATQFTLPRVLTQPRYAGIATAEDAVLDTTYTVEVERLVERGRKRELRMSHADIETAAAEAALQDALRGETFALVQAFLSAVLARENIRVLDESLRDYGRMEAIFTAQADEGYIAGVDLRRIGLELVDLQGDLSAAHIDYAQAVREVLHLTGDGETDLRLDPLVRPVSGPTAAVPVREATVLDVIDGTLHVDPVDVRLEDLRRLALAHRPDLRVVELQLEAAGVLGRMAMAERVRDVSIGAQYARSGRDNAIGVGIGIPLTTGRRAAAADAQAIAVQRQAEASWREVRARVLTEVEQAFVAFEVSRDRLQLFDTRILRYAAEVRTIEQVAWREGERGLLALLDAQRVYNQTLAAYNQARHDLALSVHQLEWATATSLRRLASH